MPQPVENAPPPIRATALSSHQSALLALSHSLESMTDVDSNEVAARSRHVLTGPQSMIDVSIDRVEGFLSQQRARFKQETSKTQRSHVEDSVGVREGLERITHR